MRIPAWRRVAAMALAMLAVVAMRPGAEDVPARPPLDKAAEKWVAKTLKSMSLDERIGQLIVPSFDSSFLSADTDAFESLLQLARDYHVGGFHLFGARELAPAVLLNPAYGTVTLGDPMSAAASLNRLQAAARIPLLNTADFETGAGMRLLGATLFPKAMAFGAAHDERLAFEAGRITAIESRAIGVHVDFAPVVDVNNNPRNPVINTRSFGEDPAFVGSIASAFVRGLHDGGMLATLKHFPGHGDTDIDSHLGIPLIEQPRERLDRIELPPFRAGIGAGADGVMTAHIALPAVDPARNTPATLSRPVVTGLLRGDLGFDGLVYTDSMSMDAVTKIAPPGDAAVRAVQAGNDVVLHSPDPVAAFAAIKAAVERGEIAADQVETSVARILRAKARLGLQQNRFVDLQAVAEKVGGRAHDAVAQEVSRRAITLLKDDRNQVPLLVPRESTILYLSVLDYPGGWRIAAPSRTFIPELKNRWPNVTAIELSDRSTASEIDLVRSGVGRYDAVIASIFVRTNSGSGRMDLAPSLVRLLGDLARTTGSRTPLVAFMFGNPYVATFLPELPAVILTYDISDHAEMAAVRALAGEAPIGGRLPIALPGFFPLGHGLDRSAK